MAGRELKDKVSVDKVLILSCWQELVGYMIQHGTYMESRWQLLEGHLSLPTREQMEI